MLKLTLSFKLLERNLSTVIGSEQLPEKSTVQINDHFRRTALMEVRNLLDLSAIFDLEIFFAFCLSFS